jgi:hypothetical protein
MATEDLYIIFLSIMVIVNLKCVKVDNHFTLPVFSSIMKLDFLTSTHNFLVQERDMM